MKYYESGKLLISHNLDSNNLRVRNIIGIKKLSYSVEEFKSMNSTELSKEKFSEKLNLYYKNNKEEWEWEGKTYRSMENFEMNKQGVVTNYNLATIPKHPIDVPKFRGLVTFVYHQSRVYFMEWIPGSERCRLIDTVDFTPLKWTRPKNCSPIMCKTDKRII